ncbi:MAG: hypothetical protein WCG79_04685 [Verrucomicrobiota bacterium]
MKTTLQRMLIGGCVLGLAWWTPVTQARREMLLDVTHGQQPSDTGSDKTFFNIEECKGLGGPALKVACPAGDSFGDSAAKVTNWRPFTQVELTIFNPSSEPVTLGFNIKHQRSTNYKTRMDIPLRIAPGRNDLKVAISGMANVDGSAPDFEKIVRWYLANTTDKPITLFVGDISLTGDDAPPASAGPTLPTTGNLFAPGGVYRVKGKIGDQLVDLTITPEAPVASTTVATPVPAAAIPYRPTTGDPARLARIRAAKMPEIHAPVMFNTPEADAILSALEVYPPDNPWNLVVKDWPVHPNSRNIIASIGADRPMRYNPDMAFVIVPPDQKRVPVKIVAYPDESDKGPFPVADNTPIEGWPGYYHSEPKYTNLTLDDVQRDKLNLNDDRHAVVLDPVNRMLYEFYQLKKTDKGWQAAQTSVFDLKTNKLRPDGWTSTDAAGLPIFPATVRYDELKRGVIEHALRVTVRRTRRAYVAPATHFASKLTDENLPRMGERIRLRRDFDVTGFSPEVQTILKGLQTYGMFVADNGIDWAISVAPDERIPVLNEELRRIRGSSFEVVVPPTP